MASSMRVPDIEPLSFYRGCDRSAMQSKVFGAIDYHSSTLSCVPVLLHEEVRGVKGACLPPQPSRHQPLPDHKQLLHPHHPTTNFRVISRVDRGVSSAHVDTPATSCTSQYSSYIGRNPLSILDHPVNATDPARRHLPSSHHMYMTCAGVYRRSTCHTPHFRPPFNSSCYPPT